MPKHIFILAVALVFIGIRLFNLPEHVQFGSDAGRDMLKVWEMFQTKELTLIGPPSQYTINGREFYFGPAPYYLALPALLLGNWDVLWVSYLLIAMNAAALVFALFVLSTYIKDKRILYVFAAVSVFTPALIGVSQSYWNPNFMLPVSLVLLGLLLKTKTSRSGILFFLIGLLFGLGMQFHYSFILAVILGFLWLILNRKLNIKLFLCVTAGSFTGFLPVLLFELRNNFYNLNTLLLVMANSSAALQESKFNLFYLISLFPFAIYFISQGMAPIKNDRIIYILISLYIVFCSVIWIGAPKPALPYPVLVSLASTIKEDSPSDFNIVDQLTRDNRAMALRYLLTAQGTKPQGVEDYAQAKTLYVYSNLPLETLVKNPVWEIKSFLPYKKATRISINQTVYLHKLEK